MIPICLIFKKFYTNKFAIYYRIEDCFNNKIFFIGINIANKTLSFFESDNFNISIGTIELSSEKTFIEIPNLQHNVVLMTGLQALKMINNDNFPDNVNFMTH
jgi:hypothetical protein